MKYNQFGFYLIHNLCSEISECNATDTCLVRNSTIYKLRMCGVPSHFLSVLKLYYYLIWIK